MEACSGSRNRREILAGATELDLATSGFTGRHTSQLYWISAFHGKERRSGGEARSSFIENTNAITIKSSRDYFALEYERIEAHIGLVALRWRSCCSFRERRLRGKLPFIDSLKSRPELQWR